MRAIPVFIALNLLTIFWLIAGCNAPSTEPSPPEPSPTAENKKSLIFALKAALPEKRNAIVKKWLDETPIEQRKQELNHTDDEGNTVAHILVLSSPDALLLKRICEQAPDTCQRKNNQGQTIKQAAQKAGTKTPEIDKILTQFENAPPIPQRAPRTSSSGGTAQVPSAIANPPKAKPFVRGARPARASKVVPHLARLPRRMVVLLDKDIEGPNLNQTDALITTFALTLHQRAAPVLATYSVVNGYLELKYNLALPKSDWAKHFYQYASFDLAEWQIYRAKNSRFFLFVPKDMAWIENPESIGIDGKVVSIPSIKLAALDKFDPGDVEQLRTFVKAKELAQEIHITQIAEIFFNDDDMKTFPAIKDVTGINSDEKIATLRSLTTPWNFFIQGHGSYRGVLPYIAGVTADKMQELLLLLNQLNVQVLALSSCYSGGQNLDYLQFKKDLSKTNIPKDLRYILAVISSSDSPSTSMTFIRGDQIDLSQGLNVSAYFDGLENQSGANWLSRALRNLARHKLTEASENIPQILVPHLGWALAYRNIKDGSNATPILIVGNVSLRKHEFEKTSIIVANHHSSILLYPTKITVPLIFKYRSAKFPIILSMQRGDAFHIIESIQLANTGSGIHEFIRDAFFELKARKSKKTFFIKELVGVNDFTRITDQAGDATTIPEATTKLTNLLIESQVDDAQNSDLSLKFLANGKYWSFTFYGKLPDTKWTMPIKQIDEHKYDEAIRDLPPLIKKALPE